MKSITSFKNFTLEVNENSSGTIMYTTDDVRNAFANVEDDIKDYYAVDEDSARITLSWNLKYGDLDIEGDLDHLEFEFDTSGFRRALLRNISHDEDTKGPTFTKDEIQNAIDSAAYNKDIFLGSFNYNINSANVSIEVDENRDSTELTVRGKLEEDSIDVNDADVDTSDIIEAIIEELLKGISKRIDYA
jgi:hypothetical protein